ncbi:MAG: peptidoglycan DD-metalloendopeptidase family protein, partial [Mucilaginibacter sp.]
GKQKNDQVQVVAVLSKQQGQLKDQQRDLQRKIARTKREIDAAISREIAEAKRKALEEAAKAAKLANAANPDSKDVTTPKKTITKNSTTSEVLNATPEAAKLSNDFLGNRGRLPWPVTNGVPMQGFGVYYTEGIKNESNGIEIKTNVDASVRAVFDGTVASINNIYGTYMVVIRHGEYFTVYSNLRTVSVSKGQKVSTKQNIGAVATESSTGIPQVNFQLWKGASPVDPKIWLTPN